MFVPLGSCGCAFQHYLDAVFEVLLPYKKLVKFEVKDSLGPEARKYELRGNAIVVDGTHVFSSPPALREFLRFRFPEIP